MARNDTPPDPLSVRPKQAARMLGLSERKLWEITADQASGIPHLKLGRATLYPVDLLRDWLAAQAGKGGQS
jgi:hypothetical protein